MVANRMRGCYDEEKQPVHLMALGGGDRATALVHESLI